MKKNYSSPYFWLVRVVSLLVPRRFRAGWKREWEAELDSRESQLSQWRRLDVATRFDLFKRSSGSLWDALYLQPKRLEEDMFQDLHYGMRMLLTKPGFTIVAVLALALGIGANTAIFSVVNGILLRQLPYHEPARLVAISAVSKNDLTHPFPASPPNYLDWRDQNHSFEQMAAYTQDNFNLTGSAEPERLLATQVTANFFSTLGVNPIIGRTFLASEDQPGGSAANRVVILSHHLWSRRFGQDQTLVGKAIPIDGAGYTVVGIMPATFEFPDTDTDIWLPVGLKADPNTRMTLFLFVLGRLKPGIALSQAQTEMTGIAQRLAQQYPVTNTDWSTNLVPLHEQTVGDIRPMLLVLLGAVGFVLLIACANVANLLLARAATRTREIAVRSALGASRLRIVRQLLTESLLLSLVSAALGLIIAYKGVALLVSLAPDSIPRLKEITIDGKVLGFTVLVSILTGLIFGLAPAIQASKPDLNEALKEGGRGTAGGGRHHLRSVLVVSEVALSLVLLIGAGLLLRSFISLNHENPGFNSENLLVMDLSLPVTKYPKAFQVRDTYKQIMDRIATLPGVQTIAATTATPVAGPGALRLFNIEGHPPKSPQDYISARYTIISPGYFRALGVPLVQGRDFTERDNDQAPGVVIVDQALAHRFFPGDDPIGKRLQTTGRLHPEIPWLTVVGVVGDVRQDGLDKTTKPEMFLPYLQTSETAMSLILRASNDPLLLTASIKNAVQSIDKEEPVANIKTMDQLIANSVASRRFQMLLLGIFAGLALVLASVGIYGVMAYGVVQRTHEIGIRMAMGAQTRDVLSLIVRQGMLLAGIGVGIGLMGALALTRLIKSFLYGISATDPFTFVSIGVLLSIVALLACYIPARRATRVDPMIALRYE